MGVRFPGSVSKGIGLPTGGGGEQILAFTGSLAGALDGQPIVLLWLVEYADVAAPIIPQIIIRRGLTSAGFAVYTSNLFPIGVNGVARLFSGVAVDIPSAGLSTPYCLGFNNSNGGTSTNITNVVLCAFGL